jgi:hypothetical protein
MYRVAGHPLLQTGSKVLCAFIQDPQWDKVRHARCNVANCRINGVERYAYVVGYVVLFIKVSDLIHAELEFVWL